MDAKKARRDARLLSGSRPGVVQTISPTVIRRPMLDSMMADIASVAHHEIQGIKNKVLSGIPLDGREGRQFRDLCEIVIRQTKTEMEVERHHEQRTATLADEDLARDISKSIQGKLDGYPMPLVDSVVASVMEVLGLDVSS